MASLGAPANDQAGGVAGNAGTSATVSNADANKIISRILNAAGGRIPGIRFNVVKTTGDLPE
jgi:dihydrodipicolinate synthase/N-acetylneuraminate lyase